MSSEALSVPIFSEPATRNRSSQFWAISFVFNWLQVLGTTETPDMDQGVRQQFHPVVALLDVLETEQQPLEFVLPRKHPFYSLT